MVFYICQTKSNNGQQRLIKNVRQGKRVELLNYSLKVGDKQLLHDVNITFAKQQIHHVLGSNGVGKSCFAKSCVGLLPYDGLIQNKDGAALIGSSSNVPNEFSIRDILKELHKKFEQSQIEMLYGLLKIDNISDKLPLAKMSDGQKQKVKLLCFLASKPKIIILDEFTNALDKSSSLDLYSFLNKYIKMNEVTILNITHNLSDLEHMPGKYYFISNFEMKEVDSKEKVIEKYIKGE